MGMWLLIHAGIDVNHVSNSSYWSQQQQTSMDLIRQILSLMCDYLDCQQWLIFSVNFCFSHQHHNLYQGSLLQTEFNSDQGLGK